MPTSREMLACKKSFPIHIITDSPVVIDTFPPELEILPVEHEQVRIAIIRTMQR